MGEGERRRTESKMRTLTITAFRSRSISRYAAMVSMAMGSELPRLYTSPQRLGQWSMAEMTPPTTSSM